MSPRWGCSDACSAADFIRKKLHALFDYRHEAVRRIIEEGRVPADPSPIRPA